jgi:WD40 repeat protein
MTTIAAEERERTPVDHEHPWPGLFSFDEPSREFFRGRDQEIDGLFHLILKSRVAVFYGMAGLGKTSLLQAGLFPRLREANLLPVPVRLDFKAGIPLVQQVRDALTREVTAVGGDVPDLDPDATLWENLHRRDALFWNERSRVVMPVLVFDQFEEIFTLGNEAPDLPQFLEQLADLVEGTAPKALMRRLLDGSGAAAELDPQRHHYAVVFTLREDYLPDFEMLRHSMPSTINPRKRLGRMRIKAAEAVLSVGRHLVGEETSRAVIRFVAGTGKDQAPSVADEDLEIEPALLSVVCARLNEKRIAKGLPHIEKHLLDTNRDTIIEDFYQSAMKGLSANVRRMVEEGLLTDGGFRDSIAEDRALKEFGVSDEAIHELLRRRLIRIEPRGHVRRIELTHDLLTRVVADSRERSRRARDEEASQRERQARQEAEERERKARENERRAHESEQKALASEQRARASERMARRLLRATWIALACGVGLVAVVIFINTGRQRDKREAARTAADLAFNSALTHLGEGRQSHALALFARAIRDNPDNTAARSMALSLLVDQPWYVQRRSWPIKDAETALDLSPNGRHLLETAGATVTLRDTETARATTLQYRTPVVFAGFIPGGGRFINMTRDVVQVWSVSPMKLLRSWSGWSFVPKPPAISPDGNSIAVQTDATVDIRRIDSGAMMARISAPAQVSFIRFSPGSDKVAIGMEMETETETAFETEVWSIASARREAKQSIPAGPFISCADIRPDLAVVAVCTGEGIVLVDVVKGTKTAIPSSGGTSRVLFLPGREDILISDSSTLRSWSEWGSRTRRVGDLASWVLTRDGSRVLAVSPEGIVTCLHADSLRPCAAPLYHSDDDVVVAASDRAERIVTATQSVVRIWDAVGSLGVVEPYGSFRYAHSVQLSDGGRWMFVNDAVGIQIIDTHSGKRTGTMNGTLVAVAPVTGTAVVAMHTNTTPSKYATWDSTLKPPKPILFEGLGSLRNLTITISGDGRRALLTPSRYPLVIGYGTTGLRTTVFPLPQVYDLASRKRVDRLSGERSMGPVALDRRGSRVAMGDRNTLVIYDVASGRELAKTNQSFEVHAMAFDRSGELLVIAVGTEAVVLRASTLQPVGKALKHARPVISVEFNADSTKILTSSEDRQARIWDRRTGVAGTQIRHERRASKASFSPDETKVVTSVGRSVAPEIRVWDAATGLPLMPPLRSRRLPPAIAFTQAGITYAVQDESRMAIRQLHDTTPGEGLLLAEIAEAVAGVVAEPTGGFQLATKVPSMIDVPPALGNSVAARTLRCFVAKPRERPLSPFTSMTARQYVLSHLEKMPPTLWVTRNLADDYPGIVPEDVLRRAALSDFP